MLSVEFDHRSELSIEARAKSIEKAVDEEIKKSLNTTPALRERLIYQGLYEWVRFRFRCPEDWAVYNAVYYSSIDPENHHKALGLEWQISSLDYTTWKGVDIQPLKRQYATFTGSTHWRSCLAD